MINRSLAPVIQPIGGINWLPYERFQLQNGSSVYCLEHGEVDVLKIEIIFRAGTKYASNLSKGSLTQQLLREGTKKKSSAAFNEAIDFFGSFLNIESDRDFVSISLYCIGKYVRESLELINELLLEPLFPADQIEIKKRNSIQGLLTNRKKVSFQSRVALIGAVMGSTHYYGRISDEQSISEVSREDVCDFFDNTYFQQAPLVIVSGAVKANTIDLLNQSIGSLPVKSNLSFEKRPVQTQNGISKIEIEGSIQSSIRMGRLVCSPNHPDAAALDVCSTLLGSYFGSRLMSNLREKNGFTYGIHMSIEQFEECSMLSLHTEVGSQHATQAVEEIKKEFDLLMREAPSVDELETVVNYMVGGLLKDADGAFSQSELLRFRLLNGLDDSYHHQLVAKYMALGPEHIQEMAEKYFKADEFSTVIAG